MGLTLLLHFSAYPRVHQKSLDFPFQHAKARRKEKALLSESRSPFLPAISSCSGTATQGFHLVSAGQLGTATAARLGCQGCPGAHIKSKALDNFRGGNILTIQNQAPAHYEPLKLSLKTNQLLVYMWKIRFFIIIIIYLFTHHRDHNKIQDFRQMQKKRGEEKLVELGRTSLTYPRIFS